MAYADDEDGGPGFPQPGFPDAGGGSAGSAGESSDDPDGGWLFPDAGAFPDAGGDDEEPGEDDPDGGVPEAGTGDGGYAEADGGTPGALLAEPCAVDGDPWRCMAAGPLLYNKKVQLPIAFDWDTGWIPGGSPVQVRFFVKLPAYTRVSMQGYMAAYWPDPITIQVEGMRKTGVVEFDYGLEVGAKARLDVSVLGQHFGWEGNIPYIPQVDFHVKDAKGFDPWGWAPGATAQGFTKKVTLLELDITDAIIPIPGIGGGIALDVQGELGVNYTNKRIVVTPSNDDITGPDQETRHTWEQGAWAEYYIHPEGRLSYTGTLHLIPSLFVEILSKKFSIPLTDFPYSLELANQDWAFDPQLVHVPLPDVRSPDMAAQEAGKVVIGDQGLLSIRVPNVGEAIAHLVPKSSSNAFTVLTNYVDVQPGEEGEILVRFSPSLVGTSSAILEVETNDPDTPMLFIKMTGEGEAAPEEPEEEEPEAKPDSGKKPPKKDAGVPDEEEDSDEVATQAVATDSGACGCRAAGASEAPTSIGFVAPLFAFAAALRLRRRGASRRQSLS